MSNVTFVSGASTASLPSRKKTTLPRGTVFYRASSHQRRGNDGSLFQANIGLDSDAALASEDGRVEAAFWDDDALYLSADDVDGPCCDRDASGGKAELHNGKKNLADGSLSLQSPIMGRGLVGPSSSHDILPVRRILDMESETTTSPPRSTCSEAVPSPRSTRLDDVQSPQSTRSEPASTESSYSDAPSTFKDSEDIPCSPDDSPLTNVEEGLSASMVSRRRASSPPPTHTNGRSPPASPPAPFEESSASFSQREHISTPAGYGEATSRPRVSRSKTFEGSLVTFLEREHAFVSRECGRDPSPPQVSASATCGGSSAAISRREHVSISEQCGNPPSSLQASRSTTFEASLAAFSQREHASVSQERRKGHSSMHACRSTPVDYSLPVSSHGQFTSKTRASVDVPSSPPSSDVPTFASSLALFSKDGAPSKKGTPLPGATPIPSKNSRSEVHVSFQTARAVFDKDAPCLSTDSSLRRTGLSLGNTDDSIINDAESEKHPCGNHVDTDVARKPPQRAQRVPAAISRASKARAADHLSARYNHATTLVDGGTNSVVQVTASSTRTSLHGIAPRTRAFSSSSGSSGSKVLRGGRGKVYERRSVSGVGGKEADPDWRAPSGRAKTFVALFRGPKNSSTWKHVRENVFGGFRRRDARMGSGAHASGDKFASDEGFKGVLSPGTPGSNASTTFPSLNPGRKDSAGNETGEHEASSHAQWDVSTQSAPAKQGKAESGRFLGHSLERLGLRKRSEMP